jgi:hypothetical protein
MTHYLCIGYVKSSDGKKAIAYRPFIDGKLAEGEGSDLIFIPKKFTDNPVGWVINIDREGTKWKGFETVTTTPELPQDVLKGFRMASIAVSKVLDLESLRKRKKAIREQIGGLTIDELKEYIKKSPTHREAVKFYLWELF